jgi:hypothetical protein
VTRTDLLNRLQSIASQAVEAQTASQDIGSGSEPEISALWDLVADIESDLEAVNAYLTEIRE